MRKDGSFISCHEAKNLDLDAQGLGYIKRWKCNLFFGVLLKGWSPKRELECMVDIKGKRRILSVLLLAWKWRWQISKIIATVYGHILYNLDFNDFVVNLMSCCYTLV